MAQVKTQAKSKIKAKPKVKTKKKTRFTNIEIPAPDRAGDTEREGKMSVAWDEDPEILQRLAEVAQMMNKNMPSWEIAAECETSIATAKRDVARVRELWTRDAKERLALAKETSIAQYASVIRDARDILKEASPSLKDKYMNIILRAQERIDKVTGIADPVAVGGIPGQPVEIVDIEQVRQKRWEKVEARLNKVVQPEKDANDTRNTGTGKSESSDQ